MSKAKNQLLGCVVGVIIVMLTIAYGMFLEDMKEGQAPVLSYDGGIEYVIVGESVNLSGTKSETIVQKVKDKIVELNSQYEEQDIVVAAEA